MRFPSGLYNHSLALLTDLYQVTMAYGYWQKTMGDRQCVFHLFFRDNPFGGGYSVSCGLAYVIDFLECLKFTPNETAYLGELVGADGRALFDKKFLTYLQALELTCDVDAIPEGTIVFPQEPLIRIKGPLLQCQLIETALLNIVNFQTLIATKAARICTAAQNSSVLEFGLRRAQGIDGALAASRAAYIGGCSATSNVLAGKLFGIPVKGTHAHSWVMAFGNDADAFQAYAESVPNNCIFLVDTYDTLDGLQKATQVGRWLQKNGHEMLGVRLDSGDLASLSIKARKLLDDSGFVSTQIVVGNDLDEHAIQALRAADAAVDIWGIGTRLVTGYDQPALGGVYKLGAIQDPLGRWQDRIKVSDDVSKTTNPGIQQVRRFHSEKFVGDIIYDDRAHETLKDLDSSLLEGMHPRQCSHTDLLVPIIRNGKVMYDEPDLVSIRERVSEQVGRLPAAVKRLEKPELYPVHLEPTLELRKSELIKQSRK